LHVGLVAFFVTILLEVLLSLPAFHSSYARALALMMTIPSVGLLHGGAVHKKDVGDTVMMSFAATSRAYSEV
jgi:hypothetical protein